MIQTGSVSRTCVSDLHTGLSGEQKDTVPTVPGFAQVILA